MVAVIENLVIRANRQNLRAFVEGDFAQQALLQIIRIHLEVIGADFSDIQLLDDHCFTQGVSELHR